MATIRHPRSVAALSTLGLALALVVAVTPDAEARGTVEFCRWHQGTGTYRLVQVNERAAPRLANRVGGGLVGDPVPGMEGFVFGLGCEPVAVPPPTTTTTTTTTAPPPTAVALARAWAVDADGTEVPIAALLDTDGSLSPTAGDTVVTASYPTATAGTAFGSFGVTTHVVDGASIGLAPDGSALVMAWAQCGDAECRFEWAYYADGTRRFERYSEYVVDGPRTGLIDHFGQTTESDVVSVNPASPSSPDLLTYDAVLSITDDDFLEVRIGW